MFELLSTLTAAPGVSGDEVSAATVAAQFLKDFGETHITPMGSLICRHAESTTDLPRILLVAHLDQIGLAVTQVTEKGFLRVAPCGGPDRRSLAGARVTVHTAFGPLPGIVCSVPPHLSNGDAKTLKIEDAAIDIGLTSERAHSLVGYGDRVTFDGPLCSLLGDRVCGAALDDRAGCAAVIRATQLLSDCDTAALFVALVSQEETGSSGAATSAFEIAPDWAIAVDVSMGFLPGEHSEQCGTVGGGPMVGFSPILERRLSRRFCDIARQHAIPWQTEVMAGRTGTDADVVAIAGRGVRTGLLSIPLRFMHTPSEVVALSDIENTARLIAAVVRGGL
ncbi:MAG: M42 family peptidase [Oscillospiraceae bacterium]